METLTSLLQRPYSQNNWLQIIELTFSNVSITHPVDIPFNADLQDKIESFRQFGTVTLADGNRLPLIELKVTERVRLRQNRVQLRQLIARLIDQDTAHGVLAVFDTGEDHYRFSFTAKESDINEEGEFVESETDKKRYTYVLGRNEQTRTAAEQFALLKQKGDSVTIKDVVAAFNVEPLTKEFFDRYKKYYEDFVQFITGKRFEKDDGKWKEVKKGEPSPFHLQVFNSDDKNARNYIKLLLGRLVFIKFLQKKSWMGVPPNETEWKNGDPKFIYNLYSNFKNKDNFHSKALLPLFDHLNAHSTSDVFTQTKTKIPALNGGLFERQYENLEVLEFPAELFEGFLEFLEQYNFTIDESDPDDAEVGIDPEMLGHIFENLLEDNKDKGAFYTPKPIVKYMCQESIIEYLYTYFEKNKLLGTDEANAQLKQGIERFIKKHEGSAINDHEKTIAKALKEVKVCDPAIGSGAFPMGILLEIFGAVNLLYDNYTDSTSEVWELNAWSPARIKEHIIQNSIYGVDIEKGAVDIARLRFWLSLIIDEEEPRYLPNLDYKIVVGNSLLPKFNGKIIEIDWSPRQSLQGRAAELHKQVQQHLAEVVKAQKNYFNANNEQKTTIKEQIRTTKLQLIKSQTLFNKERFILSNQITEDDSRLNAREKKENQAKKEQLAQFDETVTYIETLIADSAIPFSHFDWKLDFPEILNPYFTSEIGFDLIIGNPPYGNIFNESEKLILRNLFQEVQFKIDAYSIFLIIGQKLLSKKGKMIFIIPSTFMDNKFEEKVRELFLNRCKILLVHELDDRIFKSAVVHSMIIGISNETSIMNYMIQTSTSLKLNEHREQIPKSYFIKQQYKSLAIRTYKHSDFLEKVKINTQRLYNVLDIRQAIKSGNDDFYIKNVKYDLNWKPILRGKDIGKYSIKNPNLFINYGSYLACPRDSKIFEQPKILIREAGNEIIATIDDLNFYIMSSLYNAILRNNSFYLKYVLALLNSSLFLYLMKLLTFDKTKGAFTKAKIYHYYELPVKNVNKKCQELFCELVDKVIYEKSNGVNSSSIEIKIDALVFKLYDLTYTEALIINPDFSYSEAEYNAIVLPENNNIEPTKSPDPNLGLFTEGTLFHNIN